MSNRIILFTKQSLTILISLLPVALISGPFLSDLIISLCAIIFTVYCFYFKDFKLFDNIFFKYFFIFYLLCLLSSLFSEFKLVSSIKSILYLRFGIFAIAFYFVLSINEKIIKYLFFSLFLSFLTLILDGYFQYFTGYNITGMPMNGVRLSSFFGDELIYGSYLVRLLPILMALFFLTKFSKNNSLIFIFFFFILTTFLAIFLSGERASFFLSILFLMYLIFMINKYSKYFFLCFVSLLILIFTSSVLNNEIKTRMFNFTMSQLGISQSGDSNFSALYKGHFLIAEDLFKSNKLIGVGPKNYRQYCYNDKKYSVMPYVCSTHPHNSHIQLLAETGLSGFLMIFSLFIILSFKSANHIYLALFKKIEVYNFSKICLMGSMLITLWPITTSGSFFNNYINIFYFFPIGIFLYLNEKTNHSLSQKI